jgi:CheY-like chemotaxis protein
MAIDGADALIQVLGHKAQLRAVITDLHMPRMGGLEFVRALRRMLPEIPITVSSGGQMDDETVLAFRSLGVKFF